MRTPERRITGRVVAADTGFGIADLRVSFELTDPRQPDKTERLGSVRTSGSGSFSFAYQRDVKLAPPTLSVRVFEPTRGARLGEEVRERAGVLESFSFALAAELIAEAGLQVPGSDQRAERDRARHRAHAAERSRVAAIELADRSKRFRERLEGQTLDDEGKRRVTAALSGHSELDNRDIVDDASDLLDEQTRVMRESAEDRINKRARRTRIGLTSEQQERFRDEGGRFLAEVDEREIHKLLKRRPRAELWRPRGPLKRYCRGPEAVDPCLKLLEDSVSEPDDGDPPVDPEPVEPEQPTEPEPSFPVLVADDIGKINHRLMAGLLYDGETSPDGLAPRAGIAEVQSSVDGFAVHSGPADVPATYDFHHVEMAFKSIWQQLFDDDAMRKGTELYQKLVELGVSPSHLFGAGGRFKAVPLKHGSKLYAPIQPAPSLEPPPALVLQVFTINNQEWATAKQDLLSAKLVELASIVVNGPPEEDTPPSWFPWPTSFGTGNRAVREKKEEAREQGEKIIEYIRAKLASPDDFDIFHENLAALSQRLKEPYLFTTFAARRGARSVNFGLMTTYRQVWTPVAYQVGELVRTTPLAPGETRRFTKRTIIKESRSDKSSSKDLEGSSTKSKDTTRSSAQIVDKAVKNAKLMTEVAGAVDFGFASASGKVNTENGSVKDSSSVKKRFREAVVQAAQEHKQERQLEVEINSSEEDFYEEAGEIKNPNDEITVTYLFYELQRRFSLEEKIHRVQPVIFVAQEFPKPHEIDEDWILAHDWILRQVILDESFVPAMDMLKDRVVGDEHALGELYKNVEQHRRIVDETKERLISIGTELESHYAALRAATTNRAETVAAEDREGIFEDVYESTFGDADPSPEALQILEDMARDAFERSAKRERETQMQLQRETSALNQASSSYSSALSRHLNRKLQISRLRVHIKANIMHYMQAIWLREPADQRYFRLHKTKVPKLTGKLTYSMKDAEDAIPLPPEWTTPVELSVTCKLDTTVEYQPLEEVADIDRLLGFRGNYMIFPLLEGNVLTDYMSLPYQDPIAGLHDPDPLATWSLDDFARYVCCLREQLSEAKFLGMRPGLQKAYEHILAITSNDDNEIVVPTGSLYIEALPGAHPLLEDFKLLHRGVDVQKAFSEVRAAELENLRLAARIHAEERDDPHIEKQVVIEGDSSVVVTDDP